VNNHWRLDPKLKARSIAWRVVLEGLAIVVAGGALALLANRLSPRGLVLGRNYFPGAVPGAVSRPAAAGASTNVNGSTNALDASSEESIRERFKARGLQLADSNVVVQLFRDPRYQRELVVFLDARDDQHYQEGHVPGAYQFDHYRAENHLATILPVCQTADQIVIYCNGGLCEDSEFSALMLAEAGVPKDKLWIYGGGMVEWKTNNLPVELGPRQSGQLLQEQPPPAPSSPVRNEP
jgi:rhodanese-related sulfurtransferase